MIILVSLVKGHQLLHINSNTFRCQNWFQTSWGQVRRRMLLENVPRFLEILFSFSQCILFCHASECVNSPLILFWDIKNNLRFVFNLETLSNSWLTNRRYFHPLNSLIAPLIYGKFFREPFSEKLVILTKNETTFTSDLFKYNTV